MFGLSNFTLLFCSFSDEYRVTTCKNVSKLLLNPDVGPANEFKLRHVSPRLLLSNMVCYLTASHMLIVN